MSCSGEYPHKSDGYVDPAVRPNQIQSGYDYEKEIANYVRIIRSLRRSLEQIRDEDYRGNRTHSHFIAKRALEENE
jgi:hypothetical protein